MPTIPEIFDSLPKLDLVANIPTEQTYYFSVDEFKYTVTFTPNKITVQSGKTVELPTCLVKISGELFLKAWDGSYVPHNHDFMSGKVKSNNPPMCSFFFKMFRK